MPYPQYQFNLAPDPLLAQTANPVDYINSIDNQINELKNTRDKMAQMIQPANNSQVVNAPAKNEPLLWDVINTEVASLTNPQKEILFNDEEYVRGENQLQMLIQQELINLVKGKVQNTKEGKELLENQLKLVKDKKNAIVEKANNEAELFKKFQIASRSNPQLTYAEFIKSLKE